jgi:dihydroorotase
MIEIRNVQTIFGLKQNLSLESQQDTIIDADNLTLLPALIDPHVHFRTPGLEYKEDWYTAAKASIAGGYTTVFDMPNTIPPTITAELLQEKNAIIKKQLQEVDIPLRYQLFFGADKAHLNEIYRVKNAIIGIKVFMGCSTGNMVIDDDSSLHAVFAIAARLNLIVAVHAEDEHLIKERKKQFSGNTDYQIHSQIRNRDVAVRAVEKAIQIAKIYQTKLYILHTSTLDEIQLIKQAKQENVPVFAETTPHHLFLNQTAYQELAGKAVMNPPLRVAADQAALFEAIQNNIIDTIGSDHAPHTHAEKEKPYGECPSGVPGIETTLPLLLNAHQQGMLSLERIVQLTSTRAREIFNLPETEDFVLVDLNKEKTVDNAKLHTKCAWSPFHGMKLQGWPVYTILKQRVFEVG